MPLTPAKTKPNNIIKTKITKKPAAKTAKSDPRETEQKRMQQRKIVIGLRVKK